MSLTITALYVYPLKSCAGISLTAAPLDAAGLQYDRRWMFVQPPDAADQLRDPFAHEAGTAPYPFVTQREIPRLALIRPAITDAALIIMLPDQPPLSIPLTEQPGETLPVSVHGGAEYVGIAAYPTVDAVVSRWLGRPVRLVRMADSCVRIVNPKYAPELAQTAFSDGYPLLLAGEAGLADLNARLAARGQPLVTMARFRPNVVIAGGAPFAEDGWTRILLDGIPFDVVKPCPRCPITTVDPATGTIPNPKEPLATLATFRRWDEGKVIFGQNIVHRGTGTLRVGGLVETGHPVTPAPPSTQADR